MSVDACPLPPLEPRLYSPAVGQWIAERYAGAEPGTGLAALHRAMPERVPSPLVLTRWRAEFPAFDLLMAEAERVRALVLMEQTVEVADDPARLAAAAKNAIAARWRMAEALDGERFAGRTGREGQRPGDGARLGVILTDAQLLAILAGGVPTAPLSHDERGTTGGSEVRPLPSDSELEKVPIRREPVLLEHDRNTPEKIFGNGEISGVVIKVAWCCENGERLGVQVCPECAATSNAYQAAMAPGDG